METYIADNVAGSTHNYNIRLETHPVYRFLYREVSLTLLCIRVRHKVLAYRVFHCHIRGSRNTERMLVGKKRCKMET